MQNHKLLLSADTTNGSARAKALELGGELLCEPAAIINYTSTGSVFILGRDDTARQAANALAQHPSLNCTLVIVEDDNSKPSIKLEVMPGGTNTKPTGLVATFQGTLAAVNGYLGNFDLILEIPQGKASLRQMVGNGLGRIDMVLNLADSGLLTSEIKPPGYYDAINSETALDNALNEIPEMVGEFEKPKYFQLDPDICAHSRSHIKACTRCIEACPTDAISSIDDLIYVNPNLCQGVGSCATACPTGAITYSYPQLSDTLQRLRVMLDAYRKTGGQDPVILFYDAGSGRDALEKIAEQLPENFIPVELEELGSVGMDTWLACLSYGASAVGLLATRETPARVLYEIKAQQSFAAPILKGMGFTEDYILLLNDSENPRNLEIPQSMRELPAADIPESNNKRKVIRAAVDHLYQYAPTQEPYVSLPSGAPFGEVIVDAQRCTLCMSCVWQCPGKALIAGGNQPQLKFVENDCVQCGLCMSTCPEDAIAPSSRYLYDKTQRQTPRVLYEEQPFLCIECGKAFASQSVIKQMTSRLKKHAMFQGEALQRIQMCEDCRVRDIYAAEMKQRKQNTSEEIT